jgi:hypothetical protein
MSLQDREWYQDEMSRKIREIEKGNYSKVEIKRENKQIYKKNQRNWMKWIYVIAAAAALIIVILTKL